MALSSEHSLQLWVSWMQVTMLYSDAAERSLYLNCRDLHLSKTYKDCGWPLYWKLISEADLCWKTHSDITIHPTVA